MQRVLPERTLHGCVLESFAACSSWREILIVSNSSEIGGGKGADEMPVKYVALLSFNKIVSLHPHLVSLHQDVILECVDDPDISIRTRALDLVVSMINSDNLPRVVGRLMSQLRLAPIASTVDDPKNDRGMHDGVTPAAESDEEEVEESLRASEHKSQEPPPLPEDYRINVIRQIVQMCSRDTYANIADFDWYIDILAQLVRVCPASRSGRIRQQTVTSEDTVLRAHADVSYEIGSELQNVAVRVRTVRLDAIKAAQSLVLIEQRHQMYPASGEGGRGVLESAVWLVGEYANLLTNAEGVLASLLHPSALQLPERILTVQLQAIPKVFATIAGSDQVSWTRERKTKVSLLLARITHFLEPLAAHPSLEIQERAVEYLELMRLASEATASQPTDDGNGVQSEPPLLLTQAIPTLFTGFELNPVAPGAQRKVPIPDDLDLDAPINERLQSLLAQADQQVQPETDEDDFYRVYHERPSQRAAPEAAADRLEPPKTDFVSYQQSVDGNDLDANAHMRKKAERKERYKDDPFYIGSDNLSGVSTPLHNIIRNSNGDEVDIDAIPIMDLSLDSREPGTEHRIRNEASGASIRPKPRKQFEIMTDETLGQDEHSGLKLPRPDTGRTSQSKGKRSLLEVDSSGLSSLPLEEDGSGSKLGFERQEEEELEMAKALQEVERLRLEMQRASERIDPRDAPPEGTLVRKKKKKTKPQETGETTTLEEGVVVKKKKKRKSKGVEGDSVEGEPVIMKPKKKRQRQVALEHVEADSELRQS